MQLTIPQTKLLIDQNISSLPPTPLPPLWDTLSGAPLQAVVTTPPRIGKRLEGPGMFHSITNIPEILPQTGNTHSFYFRFEDITPTDFLV